MAETPKHSPEPSQETQSAQGSTRQQLDDLKKSTELFGKMLNTVQQTIGSYESQMEGLQKEIDTSTVENQESLQKQMESFRENLANAKNLASSIETKLKAQQGKIQPAEEKLRNVENEFKELMEEAERQKQLADKINGKPNTAPKVAPKTAETSPEVVSGTVKVPNTNPPSRLSLYNKDRQLVGTFTIVGNGQVSEWDLRLNGRDYGQAVWNGREWDCSIDASLSAYAQVNGGALVAVARPAATPAAKPEAKPIQSATPSEAAKPKAQVTLVETPKPKTPVTQPTAQPAATPKSAEPTPEAPKTIVEEQIEPEIPRMKFPERLADSAKPTIANDQVAYDKWDGAWLLDTNDNSVYSQIVKRYQALKAIKNANPNNTLAQESFAAVITLVRAFDTVIQKGGDSADFQNMRDTEQALIRLDEALYEFEAKSVKKKAKRVPQVPIYEGELGSLLKRKPALDSIVDGDLKEQPAAVPANEVAKTKATQTPVPEVKASAVPAQAKSVEQPKRQVETVIPGQIRVRNGGQVQFIEQNGAVSQSYILNTIYGTHLTVGHYGMAEFVPATGEWVMNMPPNVREVRGAIEAPVMNPEQKQQNEKFGGVLSEYFQQPGGLNRLAARLTQAIQKYEVVKKDQERFGGRLEWQTYMQESRQLFVSYRLALPNGRWPTDQANQLALLSALEEFEQVLKDYESESDKWSENPAEPQEPVWSDAGEKLPWRDRVTRAAKAYSELQDQYDSVADESFKEVYAKLKETMKQYSTVYLEQTKAVPMDERVVTATVSQMEWLIDTYEPKLAKAKAYAEANAVKAPTNEKTESTTIPVSTNSVTDFLKKKAAAVTGMDEKKIDGFIDTTVSVVTKTTEQRADNPELRKKMIDYLFKPGQSRFEIREALLTALKLSPPTKLSDDELKSVLWMKAHLRDFAGNDGRLNAGDISAVVDNIYRDVMSRPADLHKKILQEKGIAPNSYQDVGLQKALGLVDVMTAQESSLYNQGIQAESRPLKRFFFKTFRGADYNKLQNAKAQLGQLYAVRAQIPFEVRQKIDNDLRKFLTKAHLPTYAGQRDTGHARVTEKEMLEFEFHAAKLKAISTRSLADIVLRTGASIETYLPNGLSIEDIDGLLQTGKIPGSNFWIDAPISTAVERAKRNGAQKAGLNATENETPDELPTIDLGESEPILGTPAPLE